MKNNKKIYIFIAIVSLFILLLSLSAFADYEEYYGLTIESGTTLVFNDTMQRPLNDETLELSFTSYNNTFSSIKFSISETSYTIKYHKSSGDTDVYQNASWRVNTYKTIVINQDITLGNDNLSKFLIDNVSTGLPEPPPPAPIPEAISNVKETFSFTLTSGTLIISWLVANQIALAGLYLYILIALIGVMKRFFVT